MQELTPRERVKNLLERKPVDRASFGEDIWLDTINRWKAEGHLTEEDCKDYIPPLRMEMEAGGGVNAEADLDAGKTVIEEDEETRLVRDGNGAHLRYWKNKTATPERVFFVVKDRAGWEEHIVPHLKPDRRRTDFEGYRKTRKQAAEADLFFRWQSVGIFEMMHPVCGHENLLIGMALDPDWVRDMTEKYSDLIINMAEWLFRKEGLPDGVWFFEDLGFKGRPFMSPAMYRELIMPGHKKIFAWAHGKGLRVIMHSCGMVEELVPSLIEAGVDILQAMEVKAGMDVVRLNRLYGDRMGFMGNIDIREIITNDRRRIDAELKKKILPLMQTKTPYILSSDHSTPPQVDYETFLYFRDRGLELARYG